MLNSHNYAFSTQIWRQSNNQNINRNVFFRNIGSSKEQVQALQSLVKKGEDRMEIMKAELAKSALELKQAQNWIGTNKEQFIHVQDANLKV
ncbi:hypothetical protein DPMN_075477 [Dreissena polymorpha]|uniref:Uncharacterized protein n=1 Tax=Dreissena polymorpha TaxID=45954 RepID=A0A9D3YLR6_DREPO|nr:hypothetical protein DPMN_075477 [Dreissena polymorpha]